MKRLTIALVLFTGATAEANTDFQCVQACQNAGYQYGLCLNKCSFEPAGQPSNACMMPCVYSGTPMHICQQRCAR